MAGKKVSDEDPLVGRTIDGRYRVLRRIGQGGLGAVYEGEHVEIKKPVAIKVLHGVFASTEEFRRRFEREARAASRLDHPSCVSVLDFGRVQRLEPMEGGVSLLGIPFMVMEFVRGQVLIDRIQEGPPFSIAEAIDVEVGLLAALKHAHSLGIIHRDVKPANVMLVPDDGKTRPKLLDFGLAKDLGGATDGEEPLTQAGMVFGTPSYLSPEQANGGKADVRSDLYSAGVMLFELVCGQRPFVRDDPLDVVRAHLTVPPPSPRSLNPKISPALEKVILRALAKEPAERFQSAEEFSAELSRASQSAPASSPDKSQSWQERLASWRAIPLPWRMIGLSSPLVILIFVGAWLALKKPPAPPPPAPKPALPAPLVINYAAQQHLNLAGDYQRKLWCSDAIEELDRALKSDPAVRRAPEVPRIAISCLTPKTRDKATRFLVEKLADEARPALEQAAGSDENPEVRKGAERALARLNGGE